MRLGKASECRITYSVSIKEEVKVWVERMEWGQGARNGSVGHGMGAWGMAWGRGACAYGLAWQMYALFGFCRYNDFFS